MIGTGADTQLIAMVHVLRVHTAPQVTCRIAGIKFWNIFLFHTCYMTRLSYYSCKKKVKCTLVQALKLCTGRTAHRGSRGIALLFLDHGTRRGERSASRPGRSLHPVETRYPLYRRLGGHQRRSGQVRKISPPPRFDPRTVQAVGSRYTNYATWPTIIHVISIIFGDNNVLLYFYLAFLQLFTFSHS